MDKRGTLEDQLKMLNPKFEHQREHAANFYKFHQICWVFLGLLGTILQTLFQPSEGHRAKVVAFIVTIGTYFPLLLVELVLRSNGRNHVIVEILSLSFGVLAAILEVLIINPLFGWFALGIGGVVFVSVVCHLNVQIRNDFVNTVEEIRRVMNALRNGNANEQEVNGMRVEFLDTVEEIRMDTLRNDNAIEQRLNGMQDELRNGNNGMQDELRNDNANEQQVHEMQEELRTDNAIEQQVNGMQDELRNDNANEQQCVNGMSDENQ